jgi:hypothetical protein
MTTDDSDDAAAPDDDSRPLAPRRKALPSPRARAPLPAKTRPTPPLKPKPAAAGIASNAVRLDAPHVLAPVTSPGRGADDEESGSIEPPPSSGRLRHLGEQMARDEAERELVDDATREPPEPHAAPPSSRRNLAAKRTRTPDAVAEPSDAQVRALRADVQPPPVEKPGIHRGLVAAIAFALGIAATLAAQSAMRDGNTPAAGGSDDDRVASGDDATRSTPPPSRADPGGESEPANSAEAPVAVAERSAVEPNAAGERVPRGGSIPVTDAKSLAASSSAVTSTSAAASAAPTAAVSAAPAALAEFDKAAAAAAVAGAAGAAAGCADGVHSGRAPMAITFAPSGRVTVAVIAGYSPLAGTSVGSCVANAMRSARVPPFSGGPMTVRKTVSVP